MPLRAMPPHAFKPKQPIGRLANSTGRLDQLLYRNPTPACPGVTPAPAFPLNAHLIRASRNALFRNLKNPDNMIMKKHHTWLVMAIALLGLASPAYSFDYFVDYPRDKDGKSITSRAVISGGTYKLTVLKSDYSTYPGQDSGPRCEVRVRNNYTTGTHTFESNINIATGTGYVSIFQIFPWNLRFNGGKLWTFGGVKSGNQVPDTTISFGKTFKLKTVHNTSTKNLDLYINGSKKWSETMGAGTFYNKFGPYGRSGMGDKNTITYSSVKIN